MSDDAAKLRALWEVRSEVYTLLDDVFTRVIQSQPDVALRDATEIGGALMAGAARTTHFDAVAPLEVLEGLAPLRPRLHPVVAGEDHTVFGPVRAIDIVEQLLDGRKSVAEVQSLYPELPPGAVERVIEWAVSELTARRPAVKD